MTLTRASVESIFAPLAERDYPSFFAHVSPNVDWTVPPEDGHILNPVAGHYHSIKDFATATAPLGKCLQSGGVALYLVAVTVDPEERRAAVELSANEVQKNGQPFKVCIRQYSNLYKHILVFLERIYVGMSIQ
jgi:ketosteroid isomerase-like protein